MSDDSYHGTIGGYTNHYCRCSRCSEAKAEYMRAYYYSSPRGTRVPAIANKANYIRSGPTLAEWKASRHADE